MGNGKIIVYSSNTGYTEQYAKLLGKTLELPSYKLGNVPECHKGAEVIFLGWLFAGTIVGYRKCARKYKIRAWAWARRFRSWPRACARP